MKEEKKLLSESLEEAVKENTKTTKSVTVSLEALWGRMDDCLS